jgi:hypothetical protein
MSTTTPATPAAAVATGAWRLDPTRSSALGKLIVSGRLVRAEVSR